jgi:hypothetical protein
MPHGFIPRKQRMKRRKNLRLRFAGGGVEKYHNRTHLPQSFKKGILDNEEASKGD